MPEEEKVKMSNLNCKGRKRKQYTKRFLPIRDGVQRRSERLLLSEKGISKTPKNLLKCPICNLTCRRRYDLTRHVSNDHQLSKYECANCEETFKKKKDLLEHSRNVHDNIDSLSCDKCHLAFKNKDALSEHEFSAHFLNEKKRMKEYKCLKCFDTFEGRSSFVLHMKEAHKAPYPCTKCQCAFKYKACFTKHFLLLHRKSKNNHPCTACRKTFPFKSLLLRHIRRKHENGKVMKCSPRKSHGGVKLEPPIFKSPDSNSTLAQFNFMRYPYICPECNIGFDSVYKLLKHKKSGAHVKKEEVMHSCGMCHDVFNSPEELDEHCRSSHNEPKPVEAKVLPSFKCRACDLSYGMKVNLVNHIRAKHWNERKEIGKARVCRKCRVAFRSQREFNRHILSHRTKPFRCSKCALTFHHQSTLNTHMQSFHKVTKINSFACPVCAKSFLVEDSLTKHMQSCHPRTKRFECEICKCFFDRQSELDEHTLLTHHDLESQTKETPVVEQTCDKDESSALTHKEHRDTAEECSISESTLTSNDQLDKRVSTTVQDGTLDVLNGSRSIHLESSDCTISFTMKRYLDVHVSEAHGKPTPITFKCSKCVRTFGSQNEVNRHFELVHKITSNLYQCTHCNASFNKEGALSEHVRSYHDKIEASTLLRNDINYRPQTLTDRPQYIGQSSVEEIPAVRSVAAVLRPFKCISCKATFEEKSSLTKHIQWHSANNKPITLDCFKCNDSFATQSLLDEHVKSAHEGMGFQTLDKILKPSFDCRYCYRIFSEENAMSKHAQSCREAGRSYKCSKCDMCFKKEEQLDNHDKTKHAIKIQSVASLRQFFKCPDCNFFSNQKSNLAKHVREQHSFYECLTCHECFDTKMQLEEHKFLNHMSASNLSKRFECSYCKFVCCTESALVSHTRSIHSNVKRYECSKCTDVFSSQMFLDKHIATTHRVVKSLKCPWCEAAFIMESSLKNHIESSHGKLGIDQYKCSECTEAFSSQSLLDDHMQSSHVYVLSEGKKATEFSCYHCPAVFSKEDDWVKHILILHNIIKPFQCTQCRNYFSNRKQLSEHILTVHEVIVLTDEEKSGSPKRPRCEVLKVGTEQEDKSVSDDNLLRPFLCEECGVAFSKVRELLKHTHSVHSESKNDGEVTNCAEVIFSSINNPPKDDKPYKCSLCRSSFSERFRLSYHALAVHKTELSNCEKL